MTPQPELVAADCNTPSYASDILVCNEVELLALDRLLLERIGNRRESAVDSTGDLSAQDWSRHSRLCASEQDHRSCLLDATC